MKPLGIDKRIMMVGGAAKGTKIAAKTKSIAKKITKRKASWLTKTNNHFHNVGQISIATVSIIEHLNYSIPKLWSAINRDEDSFIKHSKKEPKHLRPNFRFSRNYWNSSVSYGVSGWYF